jgi:uncharacterized Fe-S cluster-containing radical SAM superfamily protein
MDVPNLPRIVRIEDDEPLVGRETVARIIQLIRDEKLRRGLGKKAR